MIAEVCRMSALMTGASRPRGGEARASANIVVIGAGFAGLVAARELGRAGARRDRAGGPQPCRRAHLDRPQARPRPGARRHLGALGAAAWAEMTRYGREITRSPAAGEAYWLGAGGARRRRTLDEFMALIGAGQQAIVGDVRAAIPRGIDPAAGRIGGLDALSIQDRINAVGLDDEARSANEAVWAGHVNARLDQVGLSARCARRPRRAGTGSSCTRHRPRTGSWAA